MQRNWTYTFGTGKLKKAFMEGFTTADDGTLLLTEGEEHILFCRRIDSFETGFSWGRLSFHAELPEECMLVVRAAALDEEENISQYLMDPAVPVSEKKDFFDRAEGIRSVKNTDILLYELTGRFLWICLEVTGQGEGKINSLKLYNPGDNFMQTFPEIYQEPGNFFHRYLSVFSSIYNDVQEDFEQIDRYLDFDRAPKQILPYLAEWLGLQLEGGFLEEKMFRKLLKETYQLNRIKGTRQVIERLLELVLGEKAIIVERNLLDGYITAQNAQIFRKLYGSSSQDITILVDREPDEKLQAQLLLLIKQFKPVRSRVRLVFYHNCNCLDSYCYLDKNARIEPMEQGKLDEKLQIGGNIILG